MTIVQSGNNWKGEPCMLNIDPAIIKNYDKVIHVIKKKDFDHVTLICGLPGLGKSNLAITLAKYCDPDFTEKQIAFTAKEFIELTNNYKNNSAIILDESFASLNSKIGMTKDFLEVINHLQIIRQKNLFIFLCLPNYFDLNKGIAIYRSNTLFVVYGREFGERGRFALFDRNKKRMLYILGHKFMNYLAIRPNIRGKFTKQTAIDEEAYKDLKLIHLKAQHPTEEKLTKAGRQRNNLIIYMRKNLKISVNQISEIGNILATTIYAILKNYQAPT